MSSKIVNHCFHDLYLFEYFTPQSDLRDGGPVYLYADWPILNRAPFAYKKENSNSFEKIKKDAKLLNKLVYGLKDGSESDCETFITVKEQDFSKYRQLFHGMVNSCSFEHGFDINLQGSSQKLPYGNHCKPPEDDEPVRECCCPPEVPEDLKNTPCNRRHSVTSNCTIKQDTILLLKQSELEKRISAASASRRLAQRKLPKDSKESEKVDELYMDYTLFKDDWKFESKAFKDYLKNTQNRFMRDRTRINDPVLSMSKALFSWGTPYSVFEDANLFKEATEDLLEIDQMGSIDRESVIREMEFLGVPLLELKSALNGSFENSELNIYSLLSNNNDNFRLSPNSWSYSPGFVLTFDGYEYLSSEEEESKTDLNFNFNSANLGNITLTASSSHVSNLNISYGGAFNFGRVVFNKEAKEYYIFVFLNTYLWFNKNWFAYLYDNKNTGRFYLLPAEEERDKREFLSHSISPRYISYGKFFERDTDGFEEPKKTKINIQVELESGEETFTFEVYEKKTMSEKATDDTTEEGGSGGSTPSSAFEECFDAEINTQASFKDLKLKLKTWKKADFSNNATFPNPKK
jgi:hypothetical protein